MMMKLHFNRSNGIFSVRRVDRSTAFATAKNFKIPRVGLVNELSPNVHVLITRGTFIKATEDWKRPEVQVVVTKWPRVRLFIEWLKETF